MTEENISENKNNESIKKDLSPTQFEKFKKEPISFLADALYRLCGKYQMPIFILVFVLFCVLLVFVIIKNFFCNTNISSELLFVGKKEDNIIGQVLTGGFSKFVTTLTETVTLPLIVVTLMFSANDNYNSNMKSASEEDNDNIIIDLLKDLPGKMASVDEKPKMKVPMCKNNTSVSDSGDLINQEVVDSE